MRVRIVVSCQVNSFRQSSLFFSSYITPLYIPLNESYRFIVNENVVGLMYFLLSLSKLSSKLTNQSFNFIFTVIERRDGDYLLFVLCFSGASVSFMLKKINESNKKKKFTIIII